VHLFLQLLRKKYTVDVDDLSPKGKVLLQGTNMADKDEVPILTVGTLR
jgi:hypothetical protein